MNNSPASRAASPGARLLNRLKNFDRYLLLLLATVATATLLPARGEGAVIADHAVKVAVDLLFFLYGAKLAPQAIWAGLSHWRLQLVVFLSTYALFPLIGIGLHLALGNVVQSGVLTGIVFVCLLPSTVQSSIAFTSIARGNVAAALCSASISNLIGVIITPLLAAFILSSASGGFSTDALEDIAMQILLPFVVGQAARPLIGGFIARHKLLTTIVDRGSILLVIYAAFSHGMVAGIWHQLSLADLGLVVVIDAALLAVVLVVTTLGSRKLGFAKEDEIAIVFCGSKKSLASGVPMATILFPAASVGLIVLPLMLFHQIQLFTCAVLARRYGARGQKDESSARPA